MLTTLGDPESYPESQTLSDAARWQEATDSEFRSCDDHDVYDWVDASEVPAGEEIVSSRLVYTKKLWKFNEVKKYNLKCRWVARDMFRELDFN